MPGKALSAHRRGDADNALLAAFVERFEIVDVPSGSPRVPLRLDTAPAALDRLYQLLPARFPPLFERLVLLYRWPEVELDRCRLLPNPRGPDLERLGEQIRHDTALWESLGPNGYLQFGRGPSLNYDPVCFDTRRRRGDGDCQIVRIDHEEILCRYRVRVVAELAPTFRNLVLDSMK